MINANKIKKWSAIFLVSVLPIVVFNVFLLNGWGLLWAIGGAILMILIDIPLFSVIYRHPLIDLIEGKGLLVLTIDSTGVIKPYIAQVRPPYLDIKTKTGIISTIFDRNMVSYLKVPKQAIANMKEDNKYEILTLKIPKDKKYEYQFSFDAYPTLIYNKNLEAFISKETLGKMEMNSSIKHLVFYLKKKTEELTNIMRDFARYVIEMSKPKPAFGFLSSWWFWIIIIVAIILIVMLIFPNITSSFSGLVNPAMPTTPVTPKP